LEKVYKHNILRIVDICFYCNFFPEDGKTLIMKIGHAIFLRAISISSVPCAPYLGFDEGRSIQK
jgi:hypothetical protein